MNGFVIAILLCSGSNCDLIQAEPNVSYPSYEQCSTALSSKTAQLQELAARRSPGGKPAQIVCIHASETIVDVDDPYDVLETTVAHKQPDLASPFVGVAQQGQRMLVTGLVSGTNWVRVLLTDGKTGFIIADRLRKVGGMRAATTPTTATPMPTTAPPAATTAQTAPAPPTATTARTGPAPPTAATARTGPTPANAMPMPTATTPPAAMPMPTATTLPSATAARSGPAPSAVAAAHIAAVPSPHAPPVRETPQAPMPPAAAARPAVVALAKPPPPRPAPSQQTALIPPLAAPPLAKGRGEFQDCPTCPVMVPLAGGRFEMGSNEDPTERPPHPVAIHSFAIGKFEVTEAEWQACIAGGGCSYRPSPVDGAAARLPINNLSWTDASEYVRWLQHTTGKPYRLPSEAEWEYAAAAGSASRFDWGEQPGINHADCKGCGAAHDDRQPANVDAFAPNAWGLHNMEGGVAEWVEDCWHVSYKGAPADGEAWRSSNCSSHVLRGGSWMNPPSDITVRVRNFYDTGVRYEANGLRVALTLR